MKIVAISGGFDPLHIGHIRYIHAASQLGDKLIVLLNSDEFLLRKKSWVFMPFNERKELLLALADVDDVVEVIDKDQSVGETIRQCKPNIFAKGGDRSDISKLPQTELDACEAVGCEIVFGVGGSDKPQSSSWLGGKLIEIGRQEEHKRIMEAVRDYVEIFIRSI